MHPTSHGARGVGHEINGGIDAHGRTTERFASGRSDRSRAFRSGFTEEPHRSRHFLRGLRVPLRCRRHLGHRQRAKLGVPEHAHHHVPGGDRVRGPPDGPGSPGVSAPRSGARVPPPVRGAVRPAEADPVQLRRHRRRAAHRRLAGHDRRRRGTRAQRADHRQRAQLAPLSPRLLREVRRGAPAQPRLHQRGGAHRQARAGRRRRQLRLRHRRRGRRGRGPRRHQHASRLPLLPQVHLREAGGPGLRVEPAPAPAASGGARGVPHHAQAEHRAPGAVRAAEARPRAAGIAADRQLAAAVLLRARPGEGPQGARAFRREVRRILRRDLGGIRHRYSRHRFPDSHSVRRRGTPRLGQGASGLLSPGLLAALRRPVHRRYDRRYGRSFPHRGTPVARDRRISGGTEAGPRGGPPVRRPEAQPERGHQRRHQLPRLPAQPHPVRTHHVSAHPARPPGGAGWPGHHVRTAALAPPAGGRAPPGGRK